MQILRKKIIRKIDPKLNKEEMQNILKETIIYKRIKCGNLIQGVNDYFIKNQNLFIEMDYYEETLSSYLSKNFNSFDFDTKLQWTKDLAFALDYLHLHEQSHKKINTNNIFVTDNKRLVLGEIGFIPLMTNYFSVDNPNECFDMRSDIWSLGCVFYEIFTGEKYFNNIENIEINEVTLKDKKLSLLIQQMLNMNPEKRPNIRLVLKTLIKFPRKYSEYVGSLNNQEKLSNDHRFFSNNLFIDTQKLKY